VRALGATYLTGRPEDVPEVDVVIETTGVGAVIFGVTRRTRPSSVVCLVGLSPGGRTLRIDAAGLNQELVLENAAVVGSVNANLRHYTAAAEALAGADPAWLAGLLTRTVPLDLAAEALEHRDDDVKVVLALDDAASHR
jgi:threonine dehydrogenase-like Zn-dependent dehydrogenase